MISMVSRAAARAGGVAARSLMAMAALLAAVFVLAGLSLPGTAAAQPVARPISGTFADGATFSGSYTYDAATGAVTNVSISVGAGGGGPASTMVSGYRYTSGDLVFCSSAPCVGSGDRYLYLSDAVTAPSGGGVEGPCSSVGPATTVTSRPYVLV